MSRVEDDSLKLFSSKMSMKRSASVLTANELKELEHIQQMNEQLEQELNEGFDNDMKKPPKYQTMTSNQYSSNPIKSMKRNNEPKKEEHIDDLLELVEEAQGSKSIKKTTSKQLRSEDKPQAEKKGFLDDFLPHNDGEEEEEKTEYVPSQRTGGSKKLSADLKQKMGQFFGVALTKDNNQDSKPPKERAQTSDGRMGAFNQGLSTPKIEVIGQSEAIQPSGNAQQGEAIEEFATNVSRRKGRTGTLRDRDKGTSSRPQTTPADMSKNYNLDAPNRDNDSRATQDNLSNFDGTSTNYGANDNLGDRDGDDHQSDYVPSSLARTQKRGSTSKFSAPVIDSDSIGILTTKEGSKRTPYQKETFGPPQANNLQEDFQSTMSPKLPYEKTSTSNTRKPKFGDRVSIFDREVDNQTTFQPVLHQANPKTEASVPGFGFEDFLAKQQYGAYERQTLGEETMKKMLKETDDYYKGMIEDLRKHNAEERSRMDERFRQTTEMHQKEKQLLLEQTEINLQREREHLKDMHKQEIEALERLHKHEVQREKHYAEENSENLKKQLEAQIRMNALAEEIRQSSSKINLLFERTGSNENSLNPGRTREIEMKARLLEEKEMKMNSELETLEREKKRYERLIADMESKELEVLKKADEEAARIKKEYLRLSDMTDQMKEKEVEMKKALIHERAQFELLTKQKERDSIDKVEDYKRKYRELEIQRELFEAEKKEFRGSVEKTERDMLERQKRLDEKSHKIDALEADLHKRAKGVEQRDFESVKALDKLKTKIELFESERSAFEREKLKVYEIAKHTREEADATNKFKREFDTEKDRLVRMKAELDTYSISLKNERLTLDQQQMELNQLKRTMEGMRYGYVKSLNVGSPLAGTTRDSMVQSTVPETMRKAHSTTSQGFFMKPQLSPEQLNPQAVARMGLSSTFSARNLRSQPTSPKIPERKSSKIQSNSKISFDFNSYMRELKNIGQSELTNGDYISKEKELLVRNKTEIHNTSFKKALKAVTLDIEIL